MLKKVSAVEKKSLRLLTYNVQIGISANKALRGYVTQSWKHILPFKKRIINLNKIARLIRQHDIVALQEVDAGSIRSHYINQIEYLAHKAKFPFWYCQLNRNMGRFAQHSNGLVSRIPVNNIEYHALPGKIRGRGAMLANFSHENMNITLINVHLSLGKTARRLQLNYLSDLIPENQPTIILGDMNCNSKNPVIHQLFTNKNLHCATDDLKSFPSWRPQRSLDQIWVSAHLKIKKVKVKSTLLSDHLPIMIEIHV